VRVHHQCQLKKTAPILWMQLPLVGCLSEGIQQSVSSVRNGWGHIGIADVGLMNAAIVAMFETPALHIRNISWCPFIQLRHLSFCHARIGMQSSDE
jgi:hypothetical protein